MNLSHQDMTLTGPNATRPPEIYRFVPGMTQKPQPDNIITRTTSSPGKIFNGTGFYIEDDTEIGFNDLQTLFLACFATITPLILTVITGFAIRSLWRRYSKRSADKLYSDAVRNESSVESVSQPLHTHLFNNDKSTETHLTIETAEEICETATTTTKNSLQNAKTNHSNTNGSIITMTLKNNHLIVETEERNDLEEDSRATKMKYSPSARDGVFVVEVQQGVRRSPGSGNLPVIAESDQTALIHDPPSKYDEEDEEDYLDYPETTSPVNTENLIHNQTGLTQSNQSLSEFSYVYTNQVEYTNGGSDGGIKIKKPEKNTKPKITSAIFKSIDSMKSFEMLSDDLLTELIMPNNSKGSSRDDDDSIQEEQNRLGNYDPNVPATISETDK
nr:uncharacterized protein LOC111426692 [Onthophagus taurus]